MPAHVKNTKSINTIQGVLDMGISKMPSEQCDIIRQSNLNIFRNVDQRVIQRESVVGPL